MQEGREGRLGRGRDIGKGCREEVGCVRLGRMEGFREDGQGAVLVWGREEQSGGRGGVVYR